MYTKKKVFIALSGLVIAALFMAWFALVHDWRLRLTKEPAGNQHNVVELSDSQLIDLFRSVDWSKKTEVLPEALTTGFGKSQSLRAEVLKTYLNEFRAEAKNNLRNLIVADQSLELIPTLMQWVQQLDQPKMRIDGFKLLAALPPSSASYIFIKRAVLEENNEGILAAATWSLNFPDNVIDPTEIKDLVPRLHALTQHGSPEVRVASIQRLAKWDLSRRYVEQDILRILNNDGNLDCVFAAVGASVIAGISSASLKQAFFKILENPNSDLSLRSVILLHLERFSLDEIEYKKYTTLKQKVFSEESLTKYKNNR